jgi:hypothetical protein
MKILNIALVIMSCLSTDTISNPELNFFTIQKDTIIFKKSIYVTCPISWDTKRINQEMTYMYSKINFKKPDKGPVLNTDGEYSFFFKVKSSDGYNWTAVFKGVGDEFNLNNHTVETMYPDNF